MASIMCVRSLMCICCEYTDLTVIIIESANIAADVSAAPLMQAQRKIFHSSSYLILVVINTKYIVITTVNMLSGTIHHFTKFSINFRGCLMAPNEAFTPKNCRKFMMTLITRQWPGTKLAPVQQLEKYEF